MIRAHIRWMVRSDLPEVLAIDAASSDRPWSEEELIGSLRDHNTIGMVAEYHEHVVGFMVYEIRKRALVVRRLAVHPDRRRQGVGRQLLAKLVAKLTERRTSIRLDVPEADLGAQLWLRACGAVATDVLRGAGPDDADLYLFRATLPEPAPALPVTES